MICPPYIYFKLKLQGPFAVVDKLVWLDRLRGSGPPGIDKQALRVTGNVTFTGLFFKLHKRLLQTIPIWPTHPPAYSSYAPNAFSVAFCASLKPVAPVIFSRS